MHSVDSIHFSRSFDCLYDMNEFNDAMMVWNLNIDVDDGGRNFVLIASQLSYI